MKLMRSVLAILLLVPVLVFAQGSTRNHDIVSLATTIDQINVEINKSASGNVAGVTNADLTRWQSYVNALRAYAAWVVEQPSPLDMPKTSHLVMEVEDMPDMTKTQNRAADDLVRMLGLERAELVNSQSSGLSSGLISYDYNRFLSVMDKCDSRIALAATGSPIDVPITLPQLAGSPTTASQGIVLP